MYDLKTDFVDNIFKRSIALFFFLQMLNDLKYCYLIRIFLFSFYQFEHTKMVASIVIYH